MNPVLPQDSFIPDGEGRWMPDGRFYVYGSCDVGGAEDYYCSDVLHVFSTHNLIDWVDHGVCLRSSDISWAGGSRMLYAPDCICKDGKYYLYFCMNEGLEGVAISDTPYGYFTDPQPVLHADGDGIDPAVLVDGEDVYYFWGQFQLRGAKLKPNMREIDTDTMNRCILNERSHGFHEGASIRKIHGKYYLLFTDTSGGRATSLSYAVSSNPLGPYKKRGTVIDNIFCDPETWNNHGSLAEFQGQWYVLYHRSSRNSRYSRRLCMEPIFFDKNGDIAQVPMTTQGVEPPLRMNQWIPAARACAVNNGVHIAPSQDGACEVLRHAGNGSFATYRYLDFQCPHRFSVTAATPIPGVEIDIWADDIQIGVCKTQSTGNWNQYQTFSCSLTPAGGVRSLYLVFRGSSGGMGAGLIDVKAFHFSTLQEETI